VFSWLIASIGQERSFPGFVHSAING
jgi:hypothetical protein